MSTNKTLIQRYERIDKLEDEATAWSLTVENLRAERDALKAACTDYRAPSERYKAECAAAEAEWAASVAASDVEWNAALAAADALWDAARDAASAARTAAMLDARNTWHKGLA